jgi:CheY-like chemotaxis protein
MRNAVLSTHTMTNPGSFMKRLTILLVEDEPDVRSFLARALARVAPNATVRAVCDGVEALEAIAQSPPDLIVSDHRMPRMTGLELLANVRAQWPTPFIMISADVTVQSQAQTHGVSAFLAKPISLSELRMAIEQLTATP